MSFDAQVIRNTAGEVVAVFLDADPENKVFQCIRHVLDRNDTLEDALKGAKRIRGSFPYWGANWHVWNATVGFLEPAFDNNFPIFIGRRRQLSADELIEAKERVRRKR